MTYSSHQKCELQSLTRTSTIIVYVSRLLHCACKEEKKIDYAKYDWKKKNVDDTHLLLSSILFYFFLGKCDWFFHDTLAVVE